MAQSDSAVESTTRERLILAARDLFWSQGYEATSLAEIVKKAGVNPGSLYYFFKTKEDLLLAVLDWYLENLYPQLIAPILGRVSDPIERVFALLDGYRRALIATGYSYGCPIGNLALELGDSLPHAREKLARNFEGWRQWVRRFLDEAGPQLPQDLNRPELVHHDARETGRITHDRQWVVYVLFGDCSGSVSGLNVLEPLLRPRRERRPQVPCWRDPPAARVPGASQITPRSRS